MCAGVHCSIFFRYQPHISAAGQRALQLGTSKYRDGSGDRLQLPLRLCKRKDFCRFSRTSRPSRCFLAVRGDIRFRIMFRGMLRAGNERYGN